MKDENRNEENLNQEVDKETQNEVEENNLESQAQESNEPDFKDKYARLLAEFTNFQRQKDEEIKSMAKFGNSNLLSKVIDILDDIEMGLVQENISEETKNILEILKSKIIHLLNLEGVKELELKEGDEYNSANCEVLTTIPDDKNKDKIVQVVRKGYSISDRILRTAKVVVGK